MCRRSPAETACTPVFSCHALPTHVGVNQRHETHDIRPSDRAHACGAPHPRTGNGTRAVRGARSTARFSGGQTIVRCSRRSGFSTRVRGVSAHGTGTTTGNARAAHDEEETHGTGGEVPGCYGVGFAVLDSGNWAKLGGVQLLHFLPRFLSRRGVGGTFQFPLQGREEQRHAAAGIDLMPRECARFVRLHEERIHVIGVFGVQVRRS